MNITNNILTGIRIKRIELLLLYILFNIPSIKNLTGDMLATISGIPSTPSKEKKHPPSKQKASCVTVNIS
jgi:hypothetical protein